MGNTFTNRSSSRFPGLSSSSFCLSGSSVSPSGLSSPSSPCISASFSASSALSQPPVANLRAFSSARASSSSWKMPPGLVPKGTLQLSNASMSVPAVVEASSSSSSSKSASFLSALGSAWGLLTTAAGAASNGWLPYTRSYRVLALKRACAFSTSARPLAASSSRTPSGICPPASAPSNVNSSSSAAASKSESSSSPSSPPFRSAPSIGRSSTRRLVRPPCVTSSTGTSTSMPGINAMDFRRTTPSSTPSACWSFRTMDTASGRRVPSSSSPLDSLPSLLFSSSSASCSGCTKSSFRVNPSLCSATLMYIASASKTTLPMLLLGA
mmetsp:Transcript_82101/g.219719  ORF Transcript_82101/g.219719 Transcript_82101/m.219719 type:complete len:325 (+) Transcript_82101:1240-2214(+)